MDWRKGNFLKEDNASDLNILKPKLVLESGQDKNEKNMSENSERCPAEDFLNPARESGDSAKQTDTVKTVTVDEEDTRTYNTDVKADTTDVKASTATSVAMDTLLSISEVSHVWPWFSVLL